MNPFSTSFLNFIKRVSDKTSSKAIMEAMPDLYGQLPSYIDKAIVDEVSSYAISGPKKDYIIEKVRGSIAATFHFDDSFLRQLGALSRTEDKIYLIRKYLREYVKKEINLESANLEREARDKIISQDGKNPRSVFSILDPRWKRNAKPGDYKQYKEYRDEVTGLLFPDKTLAKKSSESEYSKSLESLVDNYNSGGLPLTAMATGGITGPQAALDNIAKSRFNNLARNTQVYNSAAGEFLTLKQQIILANIENKIIKNKDNPLIKEGITAAQKIVLMRAIESGSLADASRFFNTSFLTGKVGRDKKDPQELFNDLGKTNPNIKVNSSGVASVSGDPLKDFFENSIDKFQDKVKTDSRNASIDLQQSFVVSNITSLRSLIQAQGTSVDAKLMEHLKKNELANDILNLSKSLKDVAKLSGVGASQLNSVKQNILNSVTNGVIKFSSDSEKDRFVDAINKNDYRYIKKFVTPGLLGEGTFANFFEDINRNSFELAGKYDSSDLASRALNFNNYISVYRKNVLDTYIYAAQLGFDQGYLFSEIKRIGRESKFGKILAIYDTPITWDRVNAELRKGIIKQSLKLGGFLQKKFNLKKGVSQGDLENVLDLFAGKKTFNDLLKKRVTGELEKFLSKKFGVAVNFGIEVTWKNFLKSKFVSDLKLKGLKNLRFLEKRLELFAGKWLGLAGKAFKFALSKLGGKLPPIVSRLLSKGWSGFSGFFGKFINVFGKKRDLFSSASSILVSIQVFVFGCMGISILIFILGVLIFISTLSGSYSSTSSSSSDYLPGAYGDVVLDNFQPYDQNIETSRISASANYCLAGKDLNSFESNYPNWNNLKLADFEGTDDANNCKIMCNARKLMAGLAPGNNGLLSCNINASILPKSSETNHDVLPNQYVCSDFVTHAYFSDDPEMAKQGGRSVIQIDSYLKRNSDKNDLDRKYDRVDLAEINNPDNEESLNEFSPICQDLSNFKSGNVLIIRANTCNDTDYVGGPVAGLSYKTIDHLGRPADVWGAHIEIMLKVVDSGSDKLLYTVNANNVAKRPRWFLKKCATAGQYYIDRKAEATSLKGYPLDSEGKPITGPDGKLLQLNYVIDGVYGHPCRMYQIKRKTLSCFDKCEIPPSNYPDKDNY